MDWIALAGVVVALVFGVIAMCQGRAASRRSKSADKKAKGLEKKLSALGTDVETIKSAAVETRQLAEDANGISRGALMGVQESHDVDWDSDWEGDAYVLRNSGGDEALEVRGSVTINGTKRVFDRQYVGPGDKIPLDFAEVLRQHRKEATDRRAQNRRAPFPVVDDVWMHAPWVAIRVLWKSKGGVAHEQSPKNFQDSPGE